jgi:hypothetical protein
MPSSSQRGIAHILLLVILLVGLGGGLYLLNQRTNLFSKASYVSSPVVQTAFGYSLYLNLDTARNQQQFVKISHATNQNPSANFTVEAWIRPDSPTTAVNNQNAYQIVSKTKSIVFNDAYQLQLLATPLSDGNVHYHYFFRVTTGAFSGITADSDNGTVNGSNGQPINGATVSRDDFKSWRHVAGVVRNGNLYIYENGQLVAKNEYGMTNFGTSIAPVEIGARLLSDNTHDSYFKGEIDEVRISNVARYTSTQYEANLTAPTSVFLDDANTILLYHFDGNFLDSSSNRKNGEIAAGPIYDLNAIPSLRGGTSIFVNSGAAIQPSPTPTGVPTSTPPQGGTVIDVPVIGPVQIPPIFNPQPTVSVPTSTPVPVVKLQGCADSNGNGPSGIKCEGYLRQDTILCKNQDLYPYLYNSCTGGGLPINNNCPANYTRTVDNNTGQVTCLPGSAVVPTVTNIGGRAGCADSNGNGAGGLICKGYLRQDTTSCPNQGLYPYLYSNCSGGTTVTQPTSAPTSNNTTCSDQCYSDDLQTSVGKDSAGKCNASVSSISHLCPSAQYNGKTQVCNGRTYICNGSYWQ